MCLMQWQCDQKQLATCGIGRPRRVRRGATQKSATRSIASSGAPMAVVSMPDVLDAMDPVVDETFVSVEIEGDGEHVVYDRTSPSTAWIRSDAFRGVER